MFIEDNSIENNSNVQTNTISALINNFDYIKCLNEIYEDVLHNFGSIIRNKCPDFKNYGITEEQLDKNLASFLHENPEGLILIDGKNYSIDKIAFKIIGKATHEKILEYVNVLFKNCQENIISNKLAFYEKLKNAESTNSFKPAVVKYGNFNINYEYKTKENYLISIINTSILKEYMTVAASSPRSIKDFTRA